MNDGRKMGAVVLAAVGALAGWGGLQGGMARAQQPRLKSDEDSIQAFVAKNGFYEQSGPNGEFVSERDGAVFDGCRMTVHVVAVGADEPPYKRETLKFDVLIDLKKMDPKAAARPTDLNGNTLPGGREWVILKTADGQEWITLMRDGKLMSAISVWPMQGGANHAENQRVAEALGRLITACHQGP